MLHGCVATVAVLCASFVDASRLIRPHYDHKSPVVSSFSDVEGNITSLSFTGSGQMSQKCSEAPLCGEDGDLCVDKTYEDVTTLCEEHLAPIRKKFRIIAISEILREHEVDFGNAAEGAGKSGAVMQFLGSLYILKSMTVKDMSIFQGIVYDYQNYLVENAEWTMVVRIYGVLKASGKFWMLMNNFVPLKFPVLYDLKGSFYQRTGTGTMLKDNNWVDENRTINLSPSVRARVLKAVKADAKFLGDRQLLDYSLIVGHREFVLPKCGAPDFARCEAPVCVKGLQCVDAAGAVENIEVVRYHQTSTKPPSQHQTAKPWTITKPPPTSVKIRGKKNSPEWNCIGSYFCGKPQHYDITGSLADGLGHTCLGTLFHEGDHKADMTVDMYCFGIIDLLKVWNLKAWAEYIGKKMVTDEASVQKPNDYQERFEKFIRESIPDLSDQGKRVAFKPDKNLACPKFPKKCGSGAMPVSRSATIGFIVLFALSGWM